MNDLPATLEIAIPDQNIPEGAFVTVVYGDREFRGIVKQSEPDGYIYIEERERANDLDSRS